MVVLRDSDSPRCGCLAGLEETDYWVVDRICVPDPRRNCVDPETVCWRTYKARALLVLESMERAAKPDPGQCDHVPAGWCAGWKYLALERAVGCRWIEYRYRTPAASDKQRPV